MREKHAAYFSTFHQCIVDVCGCCSLMEHMENHDSCTNVCVFHALWVTHHDDRYLSQNIDFFFKHQTLKLDLSSVFFSHIFLFNFLGNCTAEPRLTRFSYTAGLRLLNKQNQIRNGSDLKKKRKKNISKKILIWINFEPAGFSSFPLFLFFGFTGTACQ